MTQFLLLLDDAGAEFIYARSTRKEIVTTGPTGVVRFRPAAIRPIEVLDEKGAARRAAGGFVLLGPLGAALGVLTGKGPTVLFELESSDGPSRKGVIPQDRYSKLRRDIERMQTYASGDLGRSLASKAGFASLLVIFVAALGLAGLILAPAVWFGGKALAKRRAVTGEAR